MGRYDSRYTPAEVEINLRSVHGGAKIIMNEKSFRDLVELGVAAALDGRPEDSKAQVKVEINIEAIHDGASVIIR